MEFRESRAPIVAAPTATWATARDATLTGNATELIVMVSTKNVYAALKATAVTASTGWYIPKGLVYHIYPKRGETNLSLIATSASAASVSIQEVC